MEARLRALIARLEHEAALWREEPARRAALRNRPLYPLRARQFHRFGAHSFVDRPTWLYGTSHIAIGERSYLLRGAWLTVEKVAWDRPAPVLVIGDGVAVRPGATISAAESIVIEDNVTFGAFVSVVDSNHTWEGDGESTLRSPVTTAPVRIGRGSWLADKVTVLAGAEIGEQCAIGANAVVRGKIPDGSIAVGVPARVVGSTRS